MILLKREPGFLFLSILFFCFSLDVQAPVSFYGTQFLGLSLLLIYRFLVYPKLSLTCLKLFFSVVLFLEFLSLIQYFYIGEDILILVYQKVIFLLSIVILLYDYLIKAQAETLKKVISFYIVFLSGTVFVQFFGFYFLNMDRSALDFGILLGGQESRTWYTGDWVYRPTSITSEPSIFVGVQFGLLSLQYLIDKDAKYSRILGVLSLCLSMSFLGLLLSLGYLIIVYSKNIKNYVFGVVSVFIFYIYSFDLINDRIERFNSGSDGSNNVKIEALQFFFSKPEIIFLGYGHLFPSKDSPQFYDALGDLTFYLNTITIYGVLFGFLFLLIFAVFLFKSESSFKEKLVIFLALVKLSNPAVLFFSCFFLFLVSILNTRKHQV